jgi:hypothetical protein
VSHCVTGAWLPADHFRDALLCDARVRGPRLHPVQKARTLNHKSACVACPASDAALRHCAQQLPLGARVGLPGAGHHRQHHLHFAGGARPSLATWQAGRTRTDACHPNAILQGLPTELALAAGSQTDTVEGTVFVTGLLAGCVTFGGAFTAVPCAPNACVLPCHHSLTRSPDAMLPPSAATCSAPW